MFREEKKIGVIIFFSICCYRICGALYLNPASPQQTKRQRKFALGVSQEYVHLHHAEFSLPENKVIISKSGSNKLTLHPVVHEPVIILHGLLGSKRNFSTLGKSLARQLKKRRRILAVDLRNHGENDDWRDEMGYPTMAGDVISFLDCQGIQKCVMVGHSIGGKVASAVALLYPERVSGLVVLDISPVKYTDDNWSWKAVKHIVEELVKIPLEKYITKKQIDVELRKTIEDPALRAFILTNIDQNERNLKWKVNMSAIANQLSVLAGFNLNTESNLRYDKDTFIINGGASKFVKSEHMVKIAQFFPHHMLTTVRGAGHWVHAESPDATLALLKKYLDR